MSLGECPQGGSPSLRLSPGVSPGVPKRVCPPPQRLARSTLTLIPLLGVHEVAFAVLGEGPGGGTLRLVRLCLQLLLSSSQVGGHRGGNGGAKGEYGGAMGGKGGDNEGQWGAKGGKEGQWGGKGGHGGPMGAERGDM